VAGRDRAFTPSNASRVITKTQSSPPLVCGQTSGSAGKRARRAPRCGRPRPRAPALLRVIRRASRRCVSRDRARRGRRRAQAPVRAVFGGSVRITASRT
jgi:hypothetical protein